MSKEIKEPKCKTCGGSGKIPRKEKQHCRLHLCADLSIPSCFRCQFYIHEKPCLDCTAPEQPPEGDFTKKIRTRWLAEALHQDSTLDYAICAILDLCDRLDRSEASRNELLTACENLKKIYIEGSGNTSWMANYSDMEAAIKANKEISGKK